VKGIVAFDGDQGHWARTGLEAVIQRKPARVRRESTLLYDLGDVFITAPGLGWPTGGGLK
jgi:hypothetical protein